METTIFEIPMLWDSSPEANDHPLIFSPEEYIEMFLWGIPLVNSLTKQRVPDRLIISKIQSAQDFVENYLGIKLFKQIITESRDFVRDEFMSFGFIKLSYPVDKPFALTGNLNDQKILDYPVQWLSARKDTSTTIGFPQIYIVPNGSSSVDLQYLAVNYSQYFNFIGARLIPNYWKATYSTGFNVIPSEIINVIGKVAAVALLPIIEMSVGASGTPMFGLGSQSLSLDGLSQSISKANGGNIFSQRLKQYGEELLKTDLPVMKSTYGGIKFDVM